MNIPLATRLATSALVALTPMTLVGQMSDGSMSMPMSSKPHLEVGATATAVVTRESPAIAGRSLTEGYLTQPAIMATASAFHDALTLKATLNFEGATIERGELNPGIYGEGYIDRRHPHTYLHELVLTGRHSFGAASASGALGKGFAPFGTDDPMARPFEKYPINHHLSQILERAVAIGALRVRNVAIEAGAFNGDEPESPGDVPNRNRYWDSWAARVTFAPFQQIEMQTSYARVKSPENALGGGVDQRKHSASVRLEDAQHSGYALFEWARTTDYAGSERTFSFNSVLAETSARFESLRGSLRWERTDRPDEERLSNQFRSAVPPTDFNILGRSRWTIETARLSAPITVARISWEPFAEVARARYSPTVTPAAFDPRQFYGNDRIWTLSAGLRVAIGMSHMRMGRYGVAEMEQRGMKTTSTMTMD